MNLKLSIYYGTDSNKKQQQQKSKQTRKHPKAANKRPHLMVLIGRNRNEGCLGEDVGAEGRVFGAKAVIFICLHNVDPRLILVHRIQDDLQ